MTLKKKTLRNDNIMSEEQITEVINTIKKAFEQEQIRDRRENYFCFKTEFDSKGRFFLIRGVSSIYPIGPIIKSEEERDWLLRKLKEKLETDDEQRIEVMCDLKKKKIIRSYYIIDLWS